MVLAPLDWAVIAGYALFALSVGVLMARRAGQDVEEFFLSGRSLPWWLAGTSMVATTFASDTPLVITGWVRSKGIWQNWQWWCFAVGNVLTVFLFARYWRRGRVMTTAELAELRYAGGDAKVLRLVQGVFQAGFTNTIILCWVILAAAKIMDVLFEVDKAVAVSIACSLALLYSVLSGFWGVVITDVVQFVMAMVGAVLLAWFALDFLGGTSELAGALEGIGASARLNFLPPPLQDGAGLVEAARGLDWQSLEFWTPSLVALSIWWGVQWWAYSEVDGGGLGVQRISAARTERDGVLAMLWYNIAHYALRPWPWILVALVSLVVFPQVEVTAPASGTVIEIEGEGETARITLQPDAGGDPVTIALAEAGEEGWRPTELAVEPSQRVAAGELLAATDDERAYVAMMVRFLPVGLLGLMVASLLAAFMSTVDTHVNLASSFFVNDIYRRFVRRSASAGHYVLVARLSTVFVLGIGGLFAWQSSSIQDLFIFFLSFLAGVGPVYILRWLWWRVRASTEIAAMLASAITASWLHLHEKIADLAAEQFGWTQLQVWSDYAWHLGPLSPDGYLTAEAKVVVITAVSLGAALLSLLLLPRPRPESLVEFYRRVRPAGLWGPVRELCPEVERPREFVPVSVGVVGGLMLIFGLLFAIGNALLGTSEATLACVLAAWSGQLAMSWGLSKLPPLNAEPGG